MTEIVVEFLTGALELVFEHFSHATARLLLPVLTFGRVNAMPIQQHDAPSFQRLPDGRIGLGPTVASFVGIAFWIGAAIAMVALG